MALYSTRHHGCRTDEYRWRGHRLIVLENELLRVGVLASKGADIMELRYKLRDLDVLWHAPQPMLPLGGQAPTVARTAGNFLDYFPGGWQEVLPNAGPATVYKGAELGQHGEIALLPWDVRVMQDTAARVEIEFAVETMRTPFRLTRRMIVESGSAALRLEETVTNLGEEDMAYAWGHHPAFGSPFLEAGCTIELPPCDVIEPAYAEGLKRRFAVERAGKYPHLETLDGSRDRVDLVQPKESRTEDVLLFHNLSEGRFTLRNPEQKIAVSFSWDRDVFPYCWCWQVYGGSWGYPYFGRIYTVALEPFNCPILPLAQAAERGLASFLKPGGHISSSLKACIRPV